MCKMAPIRKQTQPKKCFDEYNYNEAGTVCVRVYTYLSILLATLIIELVPRSVPARLIIR